MSGFIDSLAAWTARDILGPCLIAGEDCRAHGGSRLPDVPGRCTSVKVAEEKAAIRLRFAARSNADLDQRFASGPEPVVEVAARRVSDGRIVAHEGLQQAERFAGLETRLGEPHEVVARLVWHGPWS